MTPLHELNIREAGVWLRAGDLSALALTDAVLARIAATEPVIHAYVVVLADEARAAARRADLELRQGRDRGPLHGIPIAIKDIIDVAGLPTRCGSRVREDAPPAQTDAEVVTRLRAAGAVIVGKTVTHEFAGGVLSPPTRNAWDPARIPGGSSGGSGAAVGAGSCLAAIGSDTAGSIRIPAALNGVVGLKPTTGSVSTRGVFPLSWSLDTVGPLAKTVDDAMLVQQAIADAPLSAVAGDEARPDLRGVRLGVPRPYFFARLQTDVEAAVETALDALSELGAEIVDVDWKEAGAATAAGFVVVRPEMAAIHAGTLRAMPERYGPVLRSRLEAFSLFPARGYLRARQARSAVRAAVAALFTTHRLDALVTPTTGATATPVGEMAIRYPDGEEPVHAGFTRLTMPFNATGQPALSVPCGFDAAGLPIGLQVVGAPGGEAMLARVGAAYERAAGWHERRPTPRGTGDPLRLTAPD
jgi:aspartyl-tRNA(Asn)/glutamyl-tRNA(Gln) amidotransferase subunit A